MKEVKNLKIIGRAEQVYLPDFFSAPLRAKIDTGADLSSIWASSIRKEGDELHFTLLGKKHVQYTGQEIVLGKKDYSITRIANSFGDKEIRYVVKLRIKIAGRTILARLSLADRSRKTYPILIGRKLLHNKFVVDVSTGKPLSSIEKAKRQKMKLELSKMSDNLRK